MPIRFDLGHDLDLEFSRSNMEFAISQTKMVRFATKRKSKHIAWTLCLTRDLYVWPWPCIVGFKVNCPHCIESKVIIVSSTCTLLSWDCHGMGTLSALLALSEGNPPFEQTEQAIEQTVESLVIGSTSTPCVVTFTMGVISALLIFDFPHFPLALLADAFRIGNCL